MAVPRPGAFVGERGKEGVFIAEQGAPAAAAELPALQLRAEVQHLALADGGDGTAVLAAVDCYGRAVLAQARRGEGEPGLQVVAAHQLQPPDVLRCAAAGAAAAAVCLPLSMRCAVGCTTLLHRAPAPARAAAGSPAGRVWRWPPARPRRRRSRATLPRT